MHQLPNKTRSDSRSKASINNSDPGNNIKTCAEIITGATDWQSVEFSNNIEIANTVDLSIVFRYYEIYLDQYNKKMCCPLPHHNERTASFNYNKAKNVFFCFGCKNGGGPVEFVAIMNGCEKIAAAEHILSNFNSEVKLSNLSDDNDYKDRALLLIKFSSLIRIYIRNFPDENAFDRAEKIAYIFDELNNRNSISNNGLVQLIDKLEKKLMNV